MGEAVGLALGETVGLKVGEKVGVDDGMGVGKSVGEGVGLDVGQCTSNVYCTGSRTSAGPVQLTSTHADVLSSPQVNSGVSGHGWSEGATEGEYVGASVGAAVGEVVGEGVASAEQHVTIASSD